MGCVYYVADRRLSLNSWKVPGKTKAVFDALAAIV
jgi:hypothetical protein